jgi:hypothetical protein
MSVSEPVRSFLEAALVILREAQRPMTAREIVDIALERGLVRTAGRTPDATLGAQLYARVRTNPNGELVRVFEPGATRAIRGSVRWTVRLRGGARGGVSGR